MKPHKAKKMEETARPAKTVLPARRRSSQKPMTALYGLLKGTTSLSLEEIQALAYRLPEVREQEWQSME